MESPFPGFSLPGTRLGFNDLLLLKYASRYRALPKRDGAHTGSQDWIGGERTWLRWLPPGGILG
jgi:hypothetical protein